MPRITEYTASAASQGKIALSDSDVFAVDGINGVRKINANKLAEALAEKTLHNADFVDIEYSKNGLYRGANLGSGSTFVEASTSAQRTAIQNGTFDGLFIGDYWTINNRLYRIAHFNYWKNIGDIACTDNHVVLISDDHFGGEKFNSVNSTDGGYVNAAIYTDITTPSKLNFARSEISSAFGLYLLNHREFLCNATLNGADYAGAWFDSTVELMNECMLYGCNIRAATDTSRNAYMEQSSKTQLALFRLNPTYIHFRGYSYWLRDTVSSTALSVMPAYGHATNYAARTSSTVCVRPVFAVKGTTS